MSHSNRGNSSKLISTSSSSATKKSVAGKKKATSHHHVRDEEIRQLQSYIQKRNETLDDEIAVLRDKLKISKNFSGTGGSDRFSEKGRSKSPSSRSPSPHRSIKPKKQFSSSVENEHMKKLANNTNNRLAIGGKALGKVSLDSSNILSSTKQQNAAISSKMKKYEKAKVQRNIEMTEEERDHLISFLAKLRLCE
jgi:hypothetical protein